MAFVYFMTTLKPKVSCHEANFPSLAKPEVGRNDNLRFRSDDKFGIITTLAFQWSYHVKFAHGDVCSSEDDWVDANSILNLFNNRVVDQVENALLSDMVILRAWMIISAHASMTSDKFDKASRWLIVPKARCQTGDLYVKCCLTVQSLPLIFDCLRIIKCSVVK